MEAICNIVRDELQKLHPQPQTTTMPSTLGDIIPVKVQQVMESAPAPRLAPEDPVVRYATANQSPVARSRYALPRRAPWALRKPPAHEFYRSLYPTSTCERGGGGVNGPEFTDVLRRHAFTPPRRFVVFPFFFLF